MLIYDTTGVATKRDKLKVLVQVNTSGEQCTV